MIKDDGKLDSKVTIKANEADKMYYTQKKTLTRKKNKIVNLPFDN